jgi:hypothetical protein
MKYKILNAGQLMRRAQVPEEVDPRSSFYKALLSSTSHEEYIGTIGGNISVYPSTYGQGKVPVSAEAEYKYVRDNRRWIRELADHEDEHNGQEDEPDRASLSDLVSRKAVLQALAEADRIGREAFLAKYGLKPAWEYLLHHNGKTYDSKAVAGSAFQFLFPGSRPLTYNDLNGGKKGAAGHLAKLGFAVEGVELDPRDWSYEEVSMAVQDYFEMFEAVLDGKQINKAQHNTNLRAKLRDRSAGSVEMKHQNISAVLSRRGLPWLPGYVPRGNTQLLLDAVVNDFVSERPDLFDYIPAPQESPIKKDPFVAPPPGNVYQSVSRQRKAMKVDFSERDARNRNLGRAGEQWVVHVTREVLRRAGRHDLADAVRWVSDEVGDGLGYDIAAYDVDGAPLFIEVKTTNGGIGAPFLVTANEVAVSLEEPEHYAIYRVFDFAHDPKIYVLNGTIEGSCDLRPCLWKAQPK